MMWLHRSNSPLFENYTVYRCPNSRQSPSVIFIFLFLQFFCLLNSFLFGLFMVLYLSLMIICSNYDSTFRAIPVSTHAWHFSNSIGCCKPKPTNVGHTHNQKAPPLSPDINSRCWTCNYSSFCYDTGCLGISYSQQKQRAGGL